MYQEKNVSGKNVLGKKSGKKEHWNKLVLGKMYRKNCIGKKIVSGKNCIGKKMYRERK